MKLSRSSICLPSRRPAWSRRRHGFSLKELIVILIVIAVLVVMLGGFLVRQREMSGNMRCAANLRNIAQHAFIYSNMDPRNGGKFPHTYYNPESTVLDRQTTGANQPTQFSATQPTIVGENNVMASLYLLMRVTDLTSEIFNCPQAEASRAYSGKELANFSNWPSNYADVNSYSYNCPFPTPAAVTGGWRFDNALGPDYPLAADINPGETPFGGPTKVGYLVGRKLMRPANSPNHWFEGQQVAYCDVHVEWQTTPFAGVQRPGTAYRDNIYASQVNVDADGRGGVIWGMPADAADAVLLPTAADFPASAIARRTPDMMPPPEPDPRRAVITVGVIGVIVIVVGFIVHVAMKKKSQAPRSV